MRISLSLSENDLALLDKLRGDRSRPTYISTLINGVSEATDILREIKALREDVSQISMEEMISAKNGPRTMPRVKDFKIKEEQL